MGCCSCLPGCSTPTKREIVLGCFGIDNAGKTTVLKMLKGENPRGVLSTNGFSLVEFPYDSNFDIKVYDVGGGQRIRGIWANYYAEIHGVMYVHDAHDPASEAESRSILATLLQHPDIKSKPLLIVINRIDFTFDDIAFAAQLNLHQRAAEAKQHYYMIHVPEYNGYRPMSVAWRAKKRPTPLLDGFTNLIRRIQQDYVTLSEGVKAAEERLRVRQEEEREKRRLRLANAETNPDGDGFGAEESTISNGHAVPAAAAPTTAAVAEEQPTSSTGSPPLSGGETSKTPEPMGDIPSLNSGPTEPIGDDRPPSSKTFTQEEGGGQDNAAYIEDMEDAASPEKPPTMSPEQEEIHEPFDRVSRVSRPPTSISNKSRQSRPGTGYSRNQVMPLVEDSRGSIELTESPPVTFVRKMTVERQLPDRIESQEYIGAWRLRIQSRQMGVTKQQARLSMIDSCQDIYVFSSINSTLDALLAWK